MRRRTSGYAIAITAVLVLTSTSGFAAPPIECSTAGDDRCETWTEEWSGHEPASERGDFEAPAADSVVSPNGRKLYVTGVVFEDEGSGSDVATIAFRAHTGEKLWARRFEGRARNREYSSGNALALSPDGRRLYVAGDKNLGSSAQDWAVLCYRSRDGKLLWSRSGEDGAAIDIEVTPDGKRVFATGVTDEGNGWSNLGYNATTGKVVWKERFAGDDPRARPSDLEVSADGNDLFVLGAVQPDPNHHALRTVAVAYRNVAQTPSLGWITPLHDNGELALEEQLALTPDGDKLFVTGNERRLVDGREVFETETFAIDPLDGAIEWSVITPDIVFPVIAADNATVYIGGHDASNGENGPPALEAYEADSGESPWTVVHNDDRPASLYDMEVDDSRDTVVAVGVSTRYPDRSDPRCGAYCLDPRTDMISVAFDTRDGAQMWSARSSHPDEPAHRAIGYSLSIGTDGWIYVAGGVTDQSSQPDPAMLLSGFGP